MVNNMVSFLWYLKIISSTRAQACVQVLALASATLLAELGPFQVRDLQPLRALVLASSPRRRCHCHMASWYVCPGEVAVVACCRTHVPWPVPTSQEHDA